MTEASERTAIRSRRVSRWIDGTPAIWFSDEHTQSLASTCSATRWAKSGVAILSMGTTIAPRSRHPKKATTHSAQFSPQMRTLSPLPMLSRVQFAGKAMRVGQHLAVAPALHPIAAAVDVGRLRARGAESCRDTPGWWCAPSPASLTGRKNPPLAARGESLTSGRPAREQGRLWSRVSGDSNRCSR